MLISFLICFSAFWASFAMIRFSVHERHIVLWFPLCFPFFVPFFIWCHCHLFISVSELVLFVMEDTFGLRWWDCGRLYKICVVWVNLHIFQNVYHAKIYLFILFLPFSIVFLAMNILWLPRFQNKFQSLTKEVHCITAF